MVLQIFQKLSMDFTVSVCPYVCLSVCLNHARDIWACARRELPNLSCSLTFNLSFPALSSQTCLWRSQIS